MGDARKPAIGAAESVEHLWRRGNLVLHVDIRSVDTCASDIGRAACDGAVAIDEEALGGQ